MPTVSKCTRRAVIGAWCAVVAMAVFFNIRLYAPSPLADADDGVPRMLAAQLAANHAAIEGGAAERMQALFPEGLYFSYLFHGLTWVELALREPSYAPPAIREAEWCLAHLESPAGSAPFPADLPPGHGMFYSAWKCLLRSGLVLLQHGEDAGRLAELRDDCDAIAAAVGASPTPFPASYRNAAWPCDTVPAMQALSVYDHITGENRYEAVIASWLAEARQRLDPETGLLPHTTGLPDGRRNSVARATSQVIMLRALVDVDVDFAKSQYELFRQRFLTAFIGAPCVLEYPSGIHGFGDVDSGPLIFGRSLSATVMMIGVAQIYGDKSLADAIAQLGEALGMPWTSAGEKQYLAGVLPIGDIMVTYAQVARPWLTRSGHQPDRTAEVSSHWRWPIHALSLLVLLPALFFFRKRRSSSVLPLS